MFKSPTFKHLFSKLKWKRSFESDQHKQITKWNRLYVNTIKRAPIYILLGKIFYDLGFVVSLILQNRKNKKTLLSPFFFLTIYQIFE